MEQKVICCTRKLQSLSETKMVFCFQETTASLQGEGDFFISSLFLVLVVVSNSMQGEFSKQF